VMECAAYHALRSSMERYVLPSPAMESPRLGPSLKGVMLPLGGAQLSAPGCKCGRGCARRQRWLPCCVCVWSWRRGLGASRPREVKAEAIVGSPIFYSLRVPAWRKTLSCVA